MFDCFHFVHKGLFFFGNKLIIKNQRHLTPYPYLVVHVFSMSYCSSTYYSLSLQLSRVCVCTSSLLVKEFVSVVISVQY